MQTYFNVNQNINNVPVSYAANQTTHLCVKVTLRRQGKYMYRQLINNER